MVAVLVEGSGEPAGPGKRRYTPATSPGEAADGECLPWAEPSGAASQVCQSAAGGCDGRGLWLVFVSGGEGSLDCRVSPGFHTLSLRSLQHLGKVSKGSGTSMIWLGCTDFNHYIYLK